MTDPQDTDNSQRGESDELRPNASTDSERSESDGLDAQDEEHEEFLDLRATYVAEEITNVSVKHADIINILAGERRKSAEELASYPTARWYRECMRLSVWHQWYVHAIAFLPHAPFLKLKEILAELVHRKQPSASDETIDVIFAEIGAEYLIVKSEVTKREYDGVGFAKAQTLENGGSEHAVHDRSDARSCIWKNSTSPAELREWLVAMGKSEDQEFSVRSGTSAGWLMREFDESSNGGELDSLLTNVFDVWAFEGKNARKALASALLEIRSSNRLYERVLGRFKQWTKANAKSDDLMRAANVCDSDWALREPDRALDTIRSAANRNLDRHPDDLQRTLRRALSRLWRAAANEPGPTRPLAEKVLNFLADWNRDQPRAALPFWWFTTALRNELGKYPIRSPLILRLARDDWNGLAIRTAGLVRNGFGLQKAQADLKSIMDALRAHSTTNNATFEFKALLELLRHDATQIGWAPPQRGLIPELDPAQQSAPPPPQPPHTPPSAPPTPPPRASPPRRAAEPSTDYRASNSAYSSFTEFSDENNDAPTQDVGSALIGIGNAIAKVAISMLILTGTLGFLWFIGREPISEAFDRVIAQLQMSNYSGDASVSDVPEDNSGAVHPPADVSEPHWRALGRAATISDYRSFIYEYPTSPYRDEALVAVHNRIRELSIADVATPLEVSGTLGFRDLPSDEAPVTFNGYYSSSGPPVYALIRTQYAGDWYVFSLEAAPNWPLAFVPRDEVEAIMTPSTSGPTVVSSAQSLRVMPVSRGDIEQSQPEIPQRAFAREQGGYVVLTLIVDERGHVVQAEVSNEVPSGFGFGAAARRAALDRQYIPGTVAGVPARMEQSLVVRFNTCAPLRPVAQRRCYERSPPELRQRD